MVLGHYWVVLVRDAKSGQHGQRASANFSTSCANLWAAYAQKLLSLSTQHRLSSVSTAPPIFGLCTVHLTATVQLLQLLQLLIHMTSVVPEFTRHFHTQLNSLPMIQFCAVASRQQCLFHILSDYLQTTIFYMHKGKSWESTSGNICLIFPNLYCFLSSALSTLFNIFQHPSIKVIICKLCSSHINLPTR